jgi:hypothetical protein
VLFAGATRARVVAADLGAGPPVLLDRREIVMVPVIAVRPVYVAMVVMVMVMVVIAIGAVDMNLRLGRGAIILAGCHLICPVNS